MATSAIEPEHNRTAGTGTKQSRRRLLSHLHIQVPVPGSSGWSGRSSGPASAPCDRPAAADHHHHHHQERPASPSLLRSPTAWIRSKGHGFGSGKHTPRRPSGGGSFHYDARSYAQNFDEGGGREEDARKHHLYLSAAPSFLASPRQVSPSRQGVVRCGGHSHGGDGDGDGKEPARETLPIVE